MTSLRPTWEELSDEQRQDYEVIRRKRKEEFEALKKKREVEDVQMFYAIIKKDPTFTPYRNNHVEPSALERQEDEALQANKDKVYSAI